MKKKNTKTFPKGGIHPHDNKLSAGAAIVSLPPPQIATIPISQHIGGPAKACVTVGDTVKVGQLIAEAQGFISANIHSPVSGKVTKIDNVFDVTGYRKPSIIITVEGDEWMEEIDRSDTLNKDMSLTPKEIIEIIKQAGIVGLGGATFPSYVKLLPPEGKKIEYLLINGAECEPYLTSDHRIMLERAEEILVGVEILRKAAGVDTVYIGIEDNKPDAIAQLQLAAGEYQVIEVVALKTWYPQGGERQLVKAIVNREIPPPPKGLPIDVGCVVFNVATALAVYEAVQKHKPLIERVVSITGKSVQNPSNYLTRFGTPVRALIDAAGGLPDDAGKILGGGPMMGRSIATTDIPVTKGISGITIVRDAEAQRKEVLNCIRCGKCVAVCPLGLEPYLHMTLTEKARWDEAEQSKITNCCECGCCSFICPSNRPLLDYIKHGKATVNAIVRKREKNG